jgi:PST family polysaccharide transporter
MRHSVVNPDPAGGLGVADPTAISEKPGLGETDVAAVAAPELRALDRFMVAGVAWTGAAKWAVQGLSWISTIVVVRLLHPSDYGIVGMATACVAVLQPISDFGIGATIVQGRALQQRQIGQLYGFAVLVGLVCTLAGAAMAGPAAAFFGEPALKATIPVISLTFFVASFGIVPSAMLSRQMRFRRLALNETAEAVCLLVTSIGLALGGRGYWSLVIATLLSRTLGSVLALQSSPQRPLLPIPLAPIARSLRFGAWVAASTLLWYVYGSADRVVAGRVLGGAALGAYIMSLTLAAVPVEKVTQLYQRVSQAVVARVQDNPAVVGRYVLGITEAVAMLSFPLSIGLVLVADQFVHVVLGPSWTAAVVPLRILAAAAAVRSLDPLLAQVLIATGHASVNARSMAIAAVLLPGAFWIGAHWGVAGVAIVWLIGHPGVVMTRQLWCVLRLSRTRFVDYLAALAPATSCTAVMALSVLGIRAALADHAPEGVTLVVGIATGMSAYLATLFAFHRSRLRRAWAFVRRRDDASGAPTLGTRESMA